MTKQTDFYSPPTDRSLWSGRADALQNEYLFQVIQLLDLNQCDPAAKPLPGYALLGFESDEGVRRNLGNPGAQEGPNAFRQAAGKLPLHVELNVYDAGNVRCLEGDLEMAQAELKRRVTMLLSLGLTPVVIGGGHETAWGHFQGIAAHHSGDLAILNFDAHFDMRPLIDKQWGSSGTPFRQIYQALTQSNRPFHYYCAGIQPFSNTKSLFRYANDAGVNYLLAEKIHLDPGNMDFIKAVIQSHSHLYVSVCLDVFSAALAPGVSAPQPFGIPGIYVLEALKLLKASQKVISLDIVELSPHHDIHHQTAKLAAALFMTYTGS